jgi:hypothetical protein
MRKIFLFLIIIICGCSDRKSMNTFYENNCPIINVDIVSKKEKSTDYFEYDSYIILETLNTSLIHQINKIEFCKDSIFIMDSKQACVFIFDKKGKFLSKIDKRGPSPEEYVSLTDFYIDKFDNIYVYDGTQGIVVLFDFNGSFIKRVKVEKGYSFTKTGDGNWLFYLGNGSASKGNNIFKNILVYDENFKLIQDELPFNKYMHGLRHTFGSVKNVISKYDDSIYILPLLSNSIFSYDTISHHIKTAFKVNFVNKINLNIDENMKSGEIEYYLNEMNQGKIPSKVNNFHRIAPLVFFNFIYEERRWLCLFNENERKSVLCDFTFDENGLFFDPINYFSDQKNGKILSVLDGGKFEICKNLNKSNNQIINEISQNLDGIDDSNPILVFYNLKVDFLLKK